MKNMSPKMMQKHMEMGVGLAAAFALILPGHRRKR
jgi:hypothetical protein